LFTVSADSQKWKSSFQPGVFNDYPCIKALSEDLHVGLLIFLNLKNVISVIKTADFEYRFEFEFDIM